MRENRWVKWTPEMDRTLTEMRAQGIGAERCGEAVGVCKEVCSRRIRELGLPAGSHGPHGDPAPSLLREIEPFLRRTGMAATRFGREAVRDPRFVLDLRNGRVAHASSAERARAFMAMHQRVPA